MKSIKQKLLLLIALVLCGCNSTSTKTSANKNTSSISNGSSVNSTTSITTTITNTKKTGTLQLLGVNDFHGTVDESSSEPGMSKYISLIKKFEKDYENNVLLSIGDMFQGSAVSNLTKGEAVLNQMNYIGFDAMCVGNHEFDWGVDAIRNNKEKANFPFLGANIIDKATNEIANFVEPTAMIKKGDFNIGVIGIIGASTYYSISGKCVENYRFDSELNTVKKYAPTLREQGADLIVLLDHNGWSEDVLSDTTSTNTLGENYREITNYVDCVFSAHTHTTYAYEYNNTPIVQGGSNGKAISKIVVNFNNGEKSNSERYYLSSQYTLVADDGSKELLAKDSEKILPIINEELGEVRNATKDNIGNALVKMMQQYGVKVSKDNSLNLNVIGGLHNTAGLRSSGFSNGKITYGDVYKLIPFDNEFIIATATGKYIKEVLSYYSTNYLYTTISADELVDSQKYSIVSITYLTDTTYTSSPFYKYKNNFTFTSCNQVTGDFYFARDLVSDAIRTNGVVDFATY